MTRLYTRMAQPWPLPGALAQGCAEVRITSIEAGPTVLSGAMEKDLGFAVLPSLTLPCARTSTVPAPLPLLANVAAMPTGPFQVTLPVATEYEELSRAMDASIGGKLFFSKQFPKLYLEKPHVYATDDRVVIRLNLGGHVDLGGATTSLGGELYFAGHPRVIDNQLTIPDLELTPGTADGLLRLKVLLDGNSIRDQARAALRLDVSERMNQVRSKLATELVFDDDLGCVRAELLRSEITGIFPHASFLRIYVNIHAQAAMFLPCRK